MKTTRARWIWASLFLCGILVFGAMTWFTRSVLNTEQERAIAEARADLQERMRLALWRMDTLGASILLDESQRQADDTTSRLPVETRFTMKNGVLSLPEAAGHLAELKEKLTVRTLRQIVRITVDRPAPPLQEMQKDSTYNAQNRFEQKNQDAANYAEKIVRDKAVDNALQSLDLKKTVTRSSRAPQASPAAPAEEAYSERQQTAADPPSSLPNSSPPRVTWINGQLFLARQTFDGRGVDNYDGAWIKVDALKKLLLAEASDLLPDAGLATASAASNDGMVLASFPFRLELGTGGNVPREIRIETLLSLAAGWFAALLAMATAALLIRGVMRLSERRASFVSAVTHELRTPLTTFRLYSEMLETGAVKEEKRGQYLRVLSREADRLAHLVENVLAFSRIERGSARSVISTTSVTQLLDPMLERFEGRLASAGLSLAVDLTNVPASTLVHVDSAAVEHVLFNLIDNAAKYATPSNPAMVSLRADFHKSLEIRISDHGPGIPPSERRRIFRAFHKSAHDAAESRPGVGLGLALSLRLAREMGGNLRYEPQASGACFVLSLPG